MRYIGGGTNSFRENRPKQKLWHRFINKFNKKNRRQRINSPVCGLHNPYQRGNKGVSIWRRNLVIALLGLAILAWLFIIIFLPYFRINKILYSGLEIIKKEEIDNDVRTNLVKAGTWWPKNNFFILSEGKITKYLNEHYLLNSVTVTKIFPNTLEIDLEEKISSVIYDNGQAYYLLDQEGRVIKELTGVSESEYRSITTPITTTTLASASSTIATSTEKIHEPNYRKVKKEHGAYPLIFDTRNVTTTLNLIVLPEKIVQSIIFWSEAAEKQGIPRAKYFELEGIYTGIKVHNESVWDVIFQPHNDWQNQVNIIKNILKTAKPKDYIDVRYEGRVYWK